jgi:hypothetical protein
MMGKKSGTSVRSCQYNMYDYKYDLLLSDYS